MSSSKQQKIKKEEALRKLRSGIERHIEKHGTNKFANSGLVITERQITGTSRLKPELVRPREKVLFDINSSNLVLMKQKKQKEAKLLGTKMMIENNSEDDDPEILKIIIKPDVRCKDN